MLMFLRKKKKKKEASIREIKQGEQYRKGEAGSPST